MITGLLILAIAGLLAVLSHRRSRLENRIYKNVSVDDWLNVLIFPIALFIGWFFIVRNITIRPSVDIFPLDDIDILALTILFMAYGFLGNGIHFTGKILWRHLARHHNSMAYKVNEMFHGKLSHYLIYLNGLFIIFLLAVLEINHPVNYEMSPAYMRIIFTLGVIFGFVGSKTIFYTNEWFGGYNRPLSFVCFLLLSLTVALGKSYHMSFMSYPVYLFVIVLGISFISSFILRQFFIFINLGNRRKLKFLAKIFSAT